MSSIVLASGNLGKIREIQALLQNKLIIPQSEFKVAAADETGTTFIENAIIKARNAALHCQLPAIADDSGLIVDALQGAPGVISAIYAGSNATDQENLNKLIEEMRDIPFDQRQARFICVMVYMQSANDPLPIISQGIWEGRILQAPVGENGFGYDPIFWVDEYQCSSAQLETEVKNRVSHRGQSLTKLVTQISSLESAT